METEHSSPVYTIASVVGLPQRGGRRGHVPAHPGHTVRRVRAAISAGASPAEVLAMIPWGSHGSAFASDISVRGPSSASTQRIRTLVDNRRSLVVGVVYDEDGPIAFAEGRWAFALARVRGFAVCHA